MEKWINNGLVWLAVVWGALLLAFCLMGCRTKSVVEFVEVHDTLRTVQTDTVREYQWKTVHDTLRLSDVVTVTVRESGETIRVDRWRDRWKVVERHDTVDRYRAKYDSLLAVVSQTKEKEVVKEPWFWAWGWKILAAVAAIGFIGAWSKGHGARG
jgi:hypothetical protein